MKRHSSHDQRCVAVSTAKNRIEHNSSVWKEKAESMQKRLREDYLTVQYEKQEVTRWSKPLQIAE